MEPDPFSALLDVIAETKEVASKLHADLVRGDKAMALLAELVEVLNYEPGLTLYHGDNVLPASSQLMHGLVRQARALLAASPAIPPGDGDA